MDRSVKTGLAQGSKPGLLLGKGVAAQFLQQRVSQHKSHHGFGYDYGRGTALKSERS